MYSLFLMQNVLFFWSEFNPLFVRQIIKLNYPCLRAAAFDLESGQTGFRRLTITSLVSVGRLLLLDGAFISKPFADAQLIGEKKHKK